MCVSHALKTLAAMKLPSLSRVVSVMQGITVLTGIHAVRAKQGNGASMANQTCVHSTLQVQQSRLQ